MELTFKHSGKMGDIILSLPFVKQMGGAKVFYIQMGLWGFSQKEYDFILPLLQNQKYIGEVKIWNGEPVNYDLDIFRNIMNSTYRKSLCGSYYAVFNSTVQPNFDKEVWLDVPLVNFDIDFTSKVVVSRSKTMHDRAIHNPYFDEALSKGLEKNSYFLGLPDEHDFFNKEYNCNIPYYTVSNALELACVIKQASLCLCNQSAITAIAEGLKKTIILENRHDIASPDCKIERYNIFYI